MPRAWGLHQMDQKLATAREPELHRLAIELERLAAATDLESAVPEFFSLPEDSAKLARRIDEGAVGFVHDTLDEQLGDLLKSRSPGVKPDPELLASMLKAHLGGMPLCDYGNWVLFPWSRRLVHILPEDEHRELRTDRNRYKITLAEQERLRAARLGVVGLSVGNMAAITLALEGIGGSFRVADFDHLSLSNLNRLRGGVHELNVNKTVLAAREMYEIDPYLEIRRYPAGITADNIDDFLLGDGTLDLVIEECDDLYLKVRLRERCRELGIPVVMDTSDRGLFDIERFDTEPDRPLLHGLVGNVTAASLKGLTTKEKVPFVLSILEADAMSLRMTASLPEIDHSISTWPQLASGVALGGAITADAVRRILLGQLRESGRYYVDVEATIADRAGKYTTALPVQPDAPPSAEARRPRMLPPAPSSRQALDAELARWLVSHAILAPSAHNAQPWLFALRDGHLECWHDPSHDMPTLDFELGATWLAFGAVVENIDLAAGRAGYALTTELFPHQDEPRLVCRLRLAPSEKRFDPLYDQMAQRVTNRHRPSRGSLAKSMVTSLHRAARDGGARLHLATAAEDLATLASLVGACDRLSLLNEAIHREVMPGYRWTREEVEAHCDGLDIDAMELFPWERAGTQLLGDWSRVRFLRDIGGGKALEELGTKLVESATAVGLITIEQPGRASFFQAGRAMQRIWLQATADGLALHPITGLPFLLARVERGRGEGLDSDAIAEFQSMRPPLSAIFPEAAGRCETFLFRLAIGAKAPSAISLRRPLDSVLTIVDP